jgi:hypothetical protein
MVIQFLSLPPLAEEIIDCIPSNGCEVEKLLLEFASQDTTTLKGAIACQALSNKTQKRKDAANISKQIISRFTSNRPIVTFPFL